MVPKAENPKWQSAIVYNWPDKAIDLCKLAIDIAIAFRLTYTPHLLPLTKNELFFFCPSRTEAARLAKLTVTRYSSNLQQLGGNSEYHCPLKSNFNGWIRTRGLPFNRWNPDKVTIEILPQTLNFSIIFTSKSQGIKGRRCSTASVSADRQTMVAYPTYSSIQYQVDFSQEWIKLCTTTPRPCILRSTFPKPHTPSKNPSKKLNTNKPQAT